MPAVLLVMSVLLLSLVCTLLVLRWERRRAVEEPNPLQAWRALPTSVQEAHDNAALDAQEAAELAAARAAEAAKRNALFHP
ncbi:hypothetical protein [Streptomyces sp. NPDC003395]